MHVQTYKAKCASCKSEFSHPSLGDFSYGSFLFTGVRGTAFGIMRALDHVVWKLVEPTLPPEIGSEARGELIQATCAALADPIDDQPLVNHHVCPICHSSHWDWWEGEKAGIVEVPDVAFTRLLSLPEIGQKAAVVACVAGLRPNKALERTRGA